MGSIRTHQAVPISCCQLVRGQWQGLQVAIFTLIAPISPHFLRGFRGRMSLFVPPRRFIRFEFGLDLLVGTNIKFC